MADIIQFPGDEPVPTLCDPEMAHDQFLVDEGLELLAAYREIEDPEVRASILQLVKTLSASAIQR